MRSLLSCFTHTPAYTFPSIDSNCNFIYTVITIYTASLRAVRKRLCSELHRLPSTEQTTYRSSGGRTDAAIQGTRLAVSLSTVTEAVRGACHTCYS